MSIESTTAANAASKGINRRTVIKAAAWSAPVIAATIATPLASASGPTPGPQPAPAGRAYFDGGTSINTYVTQQPNYVRVNQGASIGLTVETEDGDIAPAGTYTAGTVAVVIVWGPGGTVTDASPYRLQEPNLNGWVRVGALPEQGTSGTVRYEYPTGITNGDSNRVPLPVVRLYPVGSQVLTPTYVATSLQSEYVSAGGSFRQVP